MKANSTRKQVTSTAQVNSGIRNIVMPGARRHTIVATKLTAAKIVPKPLIARPAPYRSPPRPGEKVEVESGAYANQPNDAAPFGSRKPAHTITPPNANSQ